jgi:hypothetical protein
VPPRAAFPRRVWKRIPSVWACSECNGAWSKDGEYFRDVLLEGALRNFDHPDVEVIRANRDRGNIRRREQRGRRSTFDSGISLNLVAPIFEASFQVQNIDMRRLWGVVIKTIQALAFRFRRGKVLFPAGYQAIVVELPNASDEHKVARDVLNGPHAGPLADGLLKVYYAEAESDPSEQEWLVGLYDLAIFYTRISKDKPPNSGLFPGIFQNGGKFIQPGESAYFPNLVADSVRGDIPPEIVGLKPK